MNSLISHGGSVPGGYDVATAGTLVAANNTLRKYCAFTNTSDTPIYLALYQNAAGTNTAAVGSGIYLAAEGGSFELNNVNMYYYEVWAIHDGTGTKRLSVQNGQ